jgi:hypothetical protein
MPRLGEDHHETRDDKEVGFTETLVRFDCVLCWCKTASGNPPLPFFSDRLRLTRPLIFRPACISAHDCGQKEAVDAAIVHHLQTEHHEGAIPRHSPKI